MESDKIKQLINSKNNQNLVIAWLYLKNSKKWEKGQFRDYIYNLFRSESRTGKTIYFQFNLEDGKITLRVHKYTHDGKSVCSSLLHIQNRKVTHSKKIPIEYLKGAINSGLNKIINFIDELIRRC